MSPRTEKDPVARTNNTGSGNERHPQLRVHRVVWEMSQRGDQKLGNGIEMELLIFVSEEKYSTLGKIISYSRFTQCVN